MNNQTAKAEIAYHTQQAQEAIDNINNQVQIAEYHLKQVSTWQAYLGQTALPELGARLQLIEGAKE